jgi:hypothetical protein
MPVPGGSAHALHLPVMGCAARATIKR